MALDDGDGAAVCGMARWRVPSATRHVVAALSAPFSACPAFGRAPPLLCGPRPAACGPRSLRRCCPVEDRRQAPEGSTCACERCGCGPRFAAVLALRCSGFALRSSLLFGGRFMFTTRIALRAESRQPTAQPHLTCTRRPPTVGGPLIDSQISSSAPRTARTLGAIGFDEDVEALVACRGSQSPRQNGWKPYSRMTIWNSPSPRKNR